MARALKNQEGQTPIPDLSGLRIQIAKQGELDIAEYKNNIEAAKKYLLKKLTDKNAPFTPDFFNRVHRDMFGDVWDWAGKPRRTGKSVGVEAYKIGSEINRFIHEIGIWEKEKKPVMEIASRIHHRWAWIHPYENGNGRFARMITNIYLHKKNKPAIAWPRDKDNFRRRYLDALKKADSGDFEPILKLHEGL